MSPETEDFLASVREAEDPTLADERRVLRAVQAAVAASAVVGATAATSKFSRLWAWSAGGTFKSGAAAFVLVAAAALGIAVATGESESVQAPAVLPARRVAPSVPAVLPASDTAPAAPQERGPEPALEAPVRSALAPVPANSAPAPEVRAVASLRDELAILARAQSALRRGDAAEALRVLDAPASRAPQLAAERATLRILSLCATARTAEARRAAAALERREPGSLQRDVISRSCAASVAESPR